MHLIRYGVRIWDCCMCPTMQRVLDEAHQHAPGSWQDIQTSDTCSPSIRCRVSQADLLARIACRITDGTQHVHIDEWEKLLMIRNQIADLVTQAIRRPKSRRAAGVRPPAIEIGRPKDPPHGDYTTSVAMQSAKAGPDGAAGDRTGHRQRTCRRPISSARSKWRRPGSSISG